LRAPFSHGQGGHHAPRKTFAVALGCDLQHTGRLVCSDELDLKKSRPDDPDRGGVSDL
jgi:predicted transcriptional regulator